MKKETVILRAIRMQGFGNNTESGIVIRGLSEGNKRRLLNTASVLDLKVTFPDRTTARILSDNSSSSEVKIEMYPGKQAPKSQRRALRRFKQILCQSGITIKEVRHPCPTHQGNNKRETDKFPRRRYR